MPSSKESTFVVDKKGLAKLMERRGKEFVLGELIQNALDEKATTVSVTLRTLGGGLAEVTVEDDNPEGFKDLSHAYTIFADSEKKNDPTKRGRFNMGEKLVIALCREARISTTKGEVRFDDGGRSMLPPTRKVGSKFEGILPMSDDEFARAVDFVQTILIPPGVLVTFNGAPIADRPVLKAFEVSLRTERADDEGVLRPTTRKTTVRLFPVRDGEKAMLYEMGIPVVETGDSWHIDVAQKVPINMDRDNVPPAWLRTLRAQVLNHAHDLLDRESASEAWVTNALTDKAVEADAVRAAVVHRFGDKAVISDPTDREGTNIAVSKGYTVVPGAALPKAAWANVREADALKPAGLVTPSPKPFSADGAPQSYLDVDHAPAAVQHAVALTIDLARAVLEADIEVKLANDSQWKFAATYGPRAHKTKGEFTYNLGTLGFKFMDLTDERRRARWLSLVIHEFAHHYADNHLSEAFYDACCDVGSRLALVLAVRSDLAARMRGESTTIAA